jgi:transposase-like protein
MTTRRKSTRKKGKRKSQTIRSNRVDRETIMRYLYVLEQNNMNVSVTAKELGLVRQTLNVWKQKYWDLYLKEKYGIVEQAETIAAVKLATVEHFAEIRGIMTTALKLCLNHAIDILQDPEQIKKIRWSDLNKLIENLSQYTIDKPGMMGAEDPSKQANRDQPTFIQNIIKQLNIRGTQIKQEKTDNSNIIQDVKE